MSIRGRRRSAHTQLARTGSGRRVVARSEAAEAPQLAGMAGDDPHDLSAGLENGPFGPFFRRFAPVFVPIFV